MRVLGIDPGLRVTGYGVILAEERGAVLLEAGTLRSDPSLSLEQRLLDLYQGICQVLEEFRPEAMALEELFAHRTFPRAVEASHARGVICLAAAQQGIPVYHYPPALVKQALTLSGRATKRQVQRVVQARLGLERLPSPPDVADALALALCHGERRSSSLLAPGGSARVGERR